VSPAGPPPASSLPFFRSRWVPAPTHVRELGLDAGLPMGFRAAGVAAGIKASGNPDVGLLVCDGEAPVSAARFTASASPAAPVLLTRERSRLDGLRVVLANSGCANAATGGRGLDDAAKTQGAAALAAGVDPAEVALASTGGISHLLPVDAVLKGILQARSRLSRDGDSAFQQAIQTTDAFEKRANLEVALPSGTVRLSAQCKGAGMISPRFATMLCFIETDAALGAETADLLLGVCVQRSFDRASVDGQLSTNDTAILMCSGSSGVRVAAESEDELRLGEALDALLRALAIMMVADGEGARRSGQLAAGEGRAARRRPELGADRAGGRSLARGPAHPRAARGGHRHRGDPGLRRRCGDPPRGDRARAGGAARGGRIRDRPPGRGRRDRGVLLRPLARVRDHQRRLHDMRTLCAT
jgi:glutamate N-acetyltransferase/amino-acid N-acetyltransferase